MARPVEGWQSNVLCITILVLTILTNIAMAAAMVLVFLRRRAQPLKFRAPYLILLIGFGSILGFTWSGLFLIRQLNSTFLPDSSLCNLWTWVMWIAYPCGVAPYFLRALRIWRVFRASDTRVGKDIEQHQQQQQQEPQPSQPQFFFAQTNPQDTHIFGGDYRYEFAYDGNHGGSSGGKGHNPGDVQGTSSVTMSPLSSMIPRPQDQDASSSANKDNKDHMTIGLLGGDDLSEYKGFDSSTFGALSNGSRHVLLSDETAATIANNTSTTGNGNSKYARPVFYKDVVTEGHLLRYFAIIIVSLISLKVLLYFLDADQGLGFGCQAEFEVPLPPLLCNGLQFCVGILILIKFRRIKDDYGAARELTVVSGMWVAAMVIELATLMIASNSLPNKWGPPDRAMTAATFNQVHGVITMLRCVFLFVVTVAWPLYQTFTVRFVSLWSDYSALHSLQALLSDIVCIQYFRAYLLHQHMSADYLSCWLEIELFNDLARTLAEGRDGMTDATSARLRPHAVRIYDKFLRPGSERMLRVVSDTARQGVVDSINNGRIAEETFSQVQGEVFAVMNSSFPRFKASIFHQQCLAELERDRQLRNVLEQSGMIDVTDLDG